MKFSILLPTRNRLDLLKYAVETVRRQDYTDWEIIISDNFSDQDIAGYVQSLHDSRIKYFRTESFVPVTDNWNNALAKSSGDYITMLGDDDCLMKGYFTAIRDLIEKYDSPDFIYNSAFLYAYPNVISGFPDGFLEPYGYAEFLKSAQEPFLLDKKKALNLARQSMNFRVLFGYNMQYAVISRQLINSLKERGKFFQSPYPDYYAMNVMLLKAERILVFPVPVVTIGISPKSFGYFYFNDSEESGAKFLKNLPSIEISSRLQDVILPGAAYDTSWLFAMETIKANYGIDFDLDVNYCRYRFLQTLHVFEKYGNNKKEARPELLKLWRLLNFWEKSAYGVFLRIVSLFPKSLLIKVLKRLRSAAGTYPHYKPKKIEGQFRNILEVFEKVDPFNRNKKYDFRLRYRHSHFIKRHIVKLVEFLWLSTYYKIRQNQDKD
jgi:glycosyltransferase involved in cell wall biosynthesis